MKVLFTVSPIRHLADGAHGKPAQQVHGCCSPQTRSSKTFPERTDYFPGLRTVHGRTATIVFAADMVHPSALAADRLGNVCSAPSGQRILPVTENTGDRKSAGSPSVPSGKRSYKKFMFQTMLKIKVFRRFPF